MVLSFNFAAVCFAQTKSGQACLSYEPTVVKLQGTLARKTYPGPPNYEDVRKGDRPESSWFVVLSHPVCVDEDKESPDLNPAHQNIRSVQLVLTQEAYKKYKGLIGKRVIATGTLFGEHTGHHHTPVLLIVGRMEQKK